MRDLPNGAELLAVAQNVLREQVLQTASLENKHNVLMIINAMSIAARQIKHGDEPERCELHAVASLLGTKCESTGDNASLRSALLDANRELCRQIRAGCAGTDLANRRALFDHLRGVARQRVLESNPKYLNA